MTATIPFNGDAVLTQLAARANSHIQCVDNERDIRVMLVDDHRILLEGLAAVIDFTPGLSVVALAVDGASAITLFRERLPDVCIVDLRMQPMDGTTLTIALRAEFPDARIILLTTFDTDEEVFRGLRAGAASYLLKDVEPTVLMETIRVVHSGKKSYSAEVSAKLAERISFQPLTARQTEVLKCLASGLSNIEIGEKLNISEGTVKAHIKAVLQKLSARDRTQATMIAFRRGLVKSS